MAYRMKRDDDGVKAAGASLTVRLLKPGWGRACACIAIMAAITGGAQSNIQPGGALRLDKSDHTTAVTQAPGPNSPVGQQDKESAQRNLAAANAEHRKQIADDSARLLKLATDLKAEVDKTTKETLSLTVIRKADEIERLAHTFKEKMKLTAAN